MTSLLNGEQELLSEEARLVSERKARMAMRMSFLSNCLLLALKAFIGFTSGSLAIIASALDSLLDLISGAILFLTSRAMNQHDVYKYPIGKVGAAHTPDSPPGPPLCAWGGGSGPRRGGRPARRRTDAHVLAAARTRALRNAWSRWG